VTVGAPAPRHHYVPRRPVVPASPSDVRHAPGPAAQPGPSPSHAGGAAKATGHARVHGRGHGSAPGGYGAVRCCPQKPSPRPTPLNRRTGDPGRPASQAACCPGAAT
jgi:hypothetical protein